TDEWPFQLLTGDPAQTCDQQQQSAIDETPLENCTMRSALRARGSVRHQNYRVERTGMLEQQRVLELHARPWQSLRRLHLRNDLPLSLAQSWPHSRGARPSRI